MRIEIHYAYPSSPIGGIHGCYYWRPADRPRLVRGQSLSLTDTILDAFRSNGAGADVVVTFGLPERLDEWYRDMGVRHALD